MAAAATHYGVFEALPRRVYRRAGARYVEAWAAVLVASAGIMGVGGTLTVALYVNPSVAELAILLGVTVASFVGEALVASAYIRRLGEPVRAWLAGARGEEAALAAWRAGAALPFRLLRRPLLWAIALTTAAVFDAVLVALLELPAWWAVVVFPGIFVLYVYWVVVRFIAVDLGMRPVLEEVARELPERAALDAPRIPIRWRLLAAVPAINFATGAVVAGITTGGEGDLGIFALGMLATAGVTLTISMWTTLGVADSISRPIVDLSQATRRVSEGDFSIRVPVVSTDEAGELARSFNEMVAGLEERERLRDAFGTFVDPSLTERVLEEGTDLRGDEVELSILFLDIRGFTTFSERAEAQEVVARLNDLYGEVVPAILRHGGHANKFIGDGLLAVFGAPERHADHADRAVEAALEIAGLVQERYRGELRVGIGVNSGRAVVGTIGGGGRLDFTVIGDTVNTAARVESATRQTDDDVLITESTREALSRDHGEFDERPPVPLKGKSEAVRLYAPRI
jgi:adenylate cyclase